MKEKNESNKFNILENIKSKYILQLIFNDLQKAKLLNIIRYNKNIQKKLDINLNDYKESSKIEIELIVFKNYEMEFKAMALAEESWKLKFINISNKEYFHIYFNDNKV